MLYNMSVSRNLIKPLKNGEVCICYCFIHLCTLLEICYFSVSAIFAGPCLDVAVW